MLAFILRPAGVLGAVVYWTAGSMAAFVIARRARGRVTRLGWLLIASGILAWSFGDVIWNFYPLLSDRAIPSVSLADGFYILGYPLLALGTARVHPGRREGLLDALLLTLGVAIPYWLLAIQPFVESNGLRPVELITSTLYPIGDLVLLAVAARMCIGKHALSMASTFMLSGVGVVLFADAIYYGPWVGGNFAAPDWMGAFWILGYCLIAAAAVAPDRAPAETSTPRNRGLFLLIPAAAGPVLLVLDLVNVIEVDLFELLVLTAVVTVTVTLRALQLLRTVSGHVAALQTRDKELSDALAARLLAEETNAQVSRSLKASEQRFRSIFENAVEGIYQGTAGGEMKAVNPAFATMLGYDSADQLLAEVSNIADLWVDVSGRDAFLAELLADGTVRGFEVQLKRRDGTAMDASADVRALMGEDGELCGLQAFVEDVTLSKEHELRRLALEAQLHESQKMETVVRLAGGVAHDFNNLLSIIQNYTNFVAEALPEGHPSQRDLAEVVSASTRAATLTRQLLTFARRDVVEPTRVEAKDLLDDSVRLLQSVIGEDIHLRFTACERPLETIIDPRELEHCVMSLIMNACDAMPAGGYVDVVAADVTLSQAPAETLRLKPGNYATIAVVDRGVGMDAETKARAFEPFFSTKQQGAGLGLSTVHAIVQSAGGQVLTTSEPGRGSTFTIYLPLPASTLPDGVEPRPSSVAHVGNVLLAEDEVSLRLATTRILEDAGFTVVACADGAAALESFRTAETPFDLLVTDMIMPGLSGRDLAAQSGLRTVYMSGYTDALLVQGDLESEDVVFVNKPFRSGDLLAAIKSIETGARLS